ncbi:hypothetical protein [Streptomyces qaidamensis]|nr:hypothetical protein [Streptomyces qaidamensis]
MKCVAMIYGNQAEWDSFPAEAWPEAIAEQEMFLDPVSLWPVLHESAADM